MLLWLVFLIATTAGPQVSSGHWLEDTACPRQCTCRLEHMTENAIYRFIKEGMEKDKPDVPEAVILESNDVLYDETFHFDERGFLKSITCMVQTESKVQELLDQVPKDVQSITLLQASSSGNKSFKTSDLMVFEELEILEIQSEQKLPNENDCYFIIEIDEALDKLQYLNLERVILNNSHERSKKIEEEVVIFEIAQRTENGHQIIFVQKKSGENILPYKSYKERMKSSEGPLFMGFRQLTLLRIYECELHHIHWEMFEGLENLNTLILEKTEIRFISDFAFYGTPNLKSLSLAWNNLLSIQITDLAGLLELEYLDLSHNNFTQLSELSLPPFPKLKLANFASNPIKDVFPNTFEVMNTTDSLILGGFDQPLSLQANSFIGLRLLRSLKLLHLDIPLFQREILKGLVNLKSLLLTGNIPEIQYDAFLEVVNLDTLILSSCNLTKLSVDTFIGLYRLRTLDLSNNNLETLPPAIFDDLKSITELYLSGNKFQRLPRDIFNKVPAKLIRLNNNPWHCSCDMSDWKPLIVNRIKQLSIKPCDRRLDKGIDCDTSNKKYYMYVFENSVAPKCTLPSKYKNWSVFHVMRKQYRCAEFKPKLKKKTLKLKKGFLNTFPTSSTNSGEETDNNIEAMLNQNPQENLRHTRNFQKYQRLRNNSLKSNNLSI